MNAKHPLQAIAGAAVLFSLSVAGKSFAQECPEERAQAATSVAHLATCSPDGEFFVSTASDGRLTYGRAVDGATLHTFYQCHPRAVEFSPDGRLLACIGQSHSGMARIKVWNVDDGRLLCRIETEGGSDPLLSFSLDGLLLVSTSGGPRVNFWKLPEGTLRGWAGTSKKIAWIAFSKEGDAIMATGDDGRMLRISLPGF